MKKLFTLALLVPLGAWAQAPTLTATSPPRNAVSAPRNAALRFDFSTAVTGASNLRMSGSQRGNRAGTGSGDGTSSLSFQPQQAFGAGELVQATVPATVRDAGGSATPLAEGQVLQFRAAAGPATGAFIAKPLMGEGTTSLIAPTLADLNNDGNLDFIYADGQNYLTCREGDGQGNLNPPTTWGNIPISGNTPTGMTVGDVNQDGNLDVITSCSSGNARQISVSLGDGTGAFTLGAVLTATTYPLAPRVGDVNGDGKPDIVFLDGAAIGVRLGDGQGNFAAQLTVAVNGSFGIPGISGLLHLVDVNNDGRLDVLFGNGTIAQAYLGNGQGSFAAAATSVAAPNMNLVADLTSDGNPDFVYVSAGAVTVYAGNGQGGFGPTALTTLSTPTASNAAATDLDGDGDLDLVVARSFSVSNRDAYVWLNDGRGSFTAGAALPGPGNDLALGDLNNDGAIDAVLVDPYGSIIGTAGLRAVRLNTPNSSALVPGIATVSPLAPGAGTTITITGSNLSTTTTVLVGGVPVTGFVVDPVTGTITFTLPAGSTGGLVAVLTPAGTATGAMLHPLGLTAPTITSLTPAAVPAGGTVTINGTNLSGATALTVGGVAVTGFTVNAATGALTFTLPTGSTGGLVTVTTPTGTASSPTLLAILPAPTLVLFTPASALASAPVAVAVFGANLTGATAVTVGGVAVTGFVVDASGVLRFSLPAGSVGGFITVTTPGGTVTSATAIVLFQTPTITSFTPTSAPANAPVTITVLGTNLSGATAVTVGGVAVTGFTVDPGTGNLTFTLPTGSAGGVIAVTTPGGTVTSTTTLTIVLSTRAAALPVQLYPNPAHTTVHVSRPDGATTPLHAALYNTLGQLVRAVTLPATTPALDVSGLAAGIYTLRLTAGSNGSTYRLTVE